MLTYCWEIIEWGPHPTEDKKRIRHHQMVMAPDFETVLKYLEADRMDEGIEIDSIIRCGPIVAQLKEAEPEPEPAVDKSVEQEARDMLARIGLKNTDSIASSDLVELANLINRKKAFDATTGKMINSLEAQAKAMAEKK